MKSYLPTLLSIAYLTVTPAFASVLVTSSKTRQRSARKPPLLPRRTPPRGVALGVYVDNSLCYVVNGTKLNTSIALTPGKHNGVVQEWDYCVAERPKPIFL